VILAFTNHIAGSFPMRRRAVAIVVCLEMLSWRRRCIPQFGRQPRRSLRREPWSAASARWAMEVHRSSQPQTSSIDFAQRSFRPLIRRGVPARPRDLIARHECLLRAFTLGIWPSSKDSDNSVSGSGWDPASVSRSFTNVGEP
jgi:hypothetical protein